MGSHSHPKDHTIASHSDTTGTGAELDTLTDNSMADTLHRHSELSASDGTPDAVVSVDSDGILYADAAPVGIDILYSGVIGAHLTVGNDIIVGGTVDGVDIAARDHAESHSVASHNDTTATGAELDELTDASETTLHSHAADGDGATQEFFVPVTGIKTTATLGFHLSYAVLKHDLAGEYFYAVFRCPHDFTTLTHCKIICVPLTTGTIDWTVVTNFAALDEAGNTHTDGDTADGLSMTNLIMEDIDISVALTNLAADDYIGVYFLLDTLTTTTAVQVLGILFKYS